MVFFLGPHIISVNQEMPVFGLKDCVKSMMSCLSKFEKILVFTDTIPVDLTTSSIKICIYVSEAETGTETESLFCSL